jgi:hypothetical protein
LVLAHLVASMGSAPRRAVSASFANETWGAGATPCASALARRTRSVTGPGLALDGGRLALRGRTNGRSRGGDHGPAYSVVGAECQAMADPCDRASLGRAEHLEKHPRDSRARKFGAQGTGWGTCVLGRKAQSRIWAHPNRVVLRFNSGQKCQHPPLSPQVARFSLLVSHFSPSAPPLEAAIQRDAQSHDRPVAHSDGTLFDAIPTSTRS